MQTKKNNEKKRNCLMERLLVVDIEEEYDEFLLEFPFEFVLCFGI